MGAIFGIIFLLIALIIGILVIAFGVSGLIIFFMKKKTERPLKVRWGIGFVITLLLGIAIAAFPTLFFGFIFYGSSVPPENFVETEIVIEEDGYQNDRFTADGVVYERIGFQVYDDDAISTPVFSYKNKSLLGSNSCGNYYKVKTTNGFELVCDEFGLLYTTQDKRDEVIAYYSNRDNICVYYNDFYSETKLKDVEIDEIKVLIELYETLPEIDVVEENNEDEDNYFYIVITSPDGLVLYDFIFFVVYNDSVYIEYNSNYSEEGDYISTTFKKLPENISEMLIGLHENK